MDFKREFLEYILFTYDFKERDTVYVLNFLKTIENFDSRVSLVKSDSPMILTISMMSTTTYNMMCRYEDKIYLTALDIFTVIEETDCLIFVEFHFNHFESKYTEVAFREKQYLNTVQMLERELLHNQIESALLTKDKDTFLTLTKELRLLDEENKNALHKK
ncbi:YpiB family protein [Phocicoccus pinnipedialis]|uniref:IDEAL domain-containing protein n=1 Tax=Phocicoccus pinnipedialis TaxID=110845 RepID=A0A6V7RE36_9BACL|nr:YpiB family protein [Jeotgalicoccus pinnipedialis]MBP1939372.1 uncharacterized protein YpiB (UPF0302 family) [Jeotgalicoccus pinnipedialis]CAD2075637.1 hypothetical protein JEOPIN946_01068 [Jeotgalicoccus pinnipedialis]